MNTAKAEKKWYVYLLCDPDTQQPFYVGKGTGDRMYKHERFWKSNCNEQKKQVIRNILASGKEVVKKRIAEFDIEQDAYIYEWATANVYHEQITNVRPCGHGRPTKIEAPRETVSTCEPLWTVEEAAAFLQIPTSEVMNQAGLPYISFGGKTSPLRFRPESVRAWVIEREKVAS